MPIFSAPTVWIALMNAFNSVAIATAVTATLNFIAVTAASMAASKLLSPKTPGFSDSSLLDRNQTIRSPIAARTIVYGQCKTSGTLVYISTTGTKNEYLHMVIALAGHEVEEIGDVYFNDELVLTGSGSAASGKYAGYAEIYKKLGSDTQTVETNLQAATSGLTDGKWTSAHRLQGIAYVYVRLIWNAEVFVGGIPNVSAIVKGKKVYDPRTSTTAYSANAALCLRDYLTDTRLGLAMDSSEIDDTSIITAANISDEQVQVLPLSPATYENRYECNGVISTAETPDGNIGKLLSAMAGLIAYSGGKVVAYAGNYRIPAVTLTEKHFVGSINVQTKTSARDRVNGVKGVYVAPENNWQVTDFPPITSSVYVTQDNGIKYWRDVTLPMTTSSSCSQRLSVIELRRARQEITMTARFRLEAMQVRAGDTVMISNEKLGWSSKVFEVVEWHFVSDGNPPQLAVEMTLRETDSTVYSWSVGDEVAVPTAPDTTLPDPFTLAAPTNLTLTADGTTQLIQADGTAIPRIKVAWSAPSEQFIQAGGAVVIEYKQGNATTYLTWSRVEGDQTLDYISSDVRIGTSYNVRIFGESYFKVTTSYLTSAITVAKDTTAPATPTGVTISAGNGLALSLDWDDNTEPDFSEYGVYRNTTGITPASVTVDKIAETRSSRFVDTQLLLGATYYYWINAYDMVENVSGFSTRVSGVATSVSGTLNTTAPNTPNAPTFSAETNYTASDGTTFVRVTLNVPAMPTLGQLLEILYRRNGASDWQIAAQLTSGSGTVSIDDLSIGVTYDFAARALSYYNIPSAVSTVLTRANGSSGATPTSPTASYVSGEQADAVAAGTIPMYAIGIKVTASATSDVAGFELKIVSTNSDSSSSYTWYASGSVGLLAQPIQPGKDTTVFFYDTLGTTVGYGFVKLISRSGVSSTWTSIGSVQGTSGLIKRPIGTVSQYNKDAVNVTGISTGSGASVRKVLTRQPVYASISIAGGATTETYNLSISNCGFSTAPDAGWMQSADWDRLLIRYDFDDSTSTTAVLRLTMADGTNLPALGALEITGEFVEY